MHLIGPQRAETFIFFKDSNFPEKTYTVHFRNPFFYQTYKFMSIPLLGNKKAGVLALISNEISARIDGSFPVCGAAGFLVT